MADAIPTAGIAAGNAGTAGTATSNTSEVAKVDAGVSASQTASVSMDEFKKLQHGVGQLFAGMREMQETFKSFKPEQVQKVKQDELSLTARLEALESEKKAFQTSKRSVAIKAAAVDNGVPSTRLKFLVSDLTNRLGDRIVVDDFGDAAVRDETGSNMPLTTYVKQFIGTEDGEMFRAAPSTSSMPAVGQGQKVSAKHRYAEMSKDQILAEKKTNFGQWAREFHAYLAKHHDDAKAKGLA
jgi:hypothetical protein